MTASLTTKNDRYYVILNIQVDGERKQKWVSTGLTVKGNKRKAEKMMRELLEEYERMEGIVHDDVLLSDYVRLWLDKKRLDVDDITMQGYQILANNNILPYFDALALQLQKVDRDVLQQYFTEQYLHGRKNGKGGLSTSTLILHRNILSQTLDLAVENHLIVENPCKYVKLPKKERFQGGFYTISQLNDLYEAIKDEPLYSLVKIASTYGLRRSELLGLKWDSINLEAERMTIKHTVVKVTSVVEKDRTKNASSFRSFPLTADAMRIFQQALQLEQENRRLFGSEYHENDYVFKWPDGHPYSPNYVTHQFSKLLAKYDLPHIRFHDLRHSCASVLLSLGYTLEDVKEWLGHANIRMTADVYGHLDVEHKKGMAREMEKNLSLKD